MSAYYPAGIEGIVAKDAHGTYRPGQRNWTKIKHRESFDILAVLSPAAPRAHNPSSPAVATTQANS